jgi:hypothetical protein
MLKQHGAAYEVLRHEPVYTSEQAAAVRGTPLSSGAKALICKGDEEFVMFVVPADRKLASRAIRPPGAPCAKKLRRRPGRLCFAAPQPLVGSMQLRHRGLSWWSSHLWDCIVVAGRDERRQE